MESSVPWSSGRRERLAHRDLLGPRRSGDLRAAHGADAAARPWRVRILASLLVRTSGGRVGVPAPSPIKTSAGYWVTTTSHHKKISHSLLLEEAA